MDWIAFFVVSSSVATASLIWRTLLLDHPRFDAWVEHLPVIGNALVCGFCSPLWFTFVAILLMNPLSSLPVNDMAHLPHSLVPLATFVLGWLVTGYAVLLLRFLFITLFEVSGVFGHQHRELHKKPEEGAA